MVSAHLHVFRIEISVSILCTSIPVIKPLVLRVAPRLLLSTSDRSRGDTYQRNGSSHATDDRRRNSFALRSIKVTHDITQVEDDAVSMQDYGLQQPDVSRGFDSGSFLEVDKDAINENLRKSDEHLVSDVRRSESVTSSTKEVLPAAAAPGSSEMQ
jgi:hypothetical protein